jgi:hypothetical protein
VDVAKNVVAGSRKIRFDALPWLPWLGEGNIGREGVRDRDFIVCLAMMWSYHT